jgi:hypothetical protein
MQIYCISVLSITSIADGSVPTESTQAAVDSISGMKERKGNRDEQIKSLYVDHANMYVLVE